MGGPISHHIVLDLAAADVSLSMLLQEGILRFISEISEASLEVLNFNNIMSLRGCQNC